MHKEKYFEIYYQAINDRKKIDLNNQETRSKMIFNAFEKYSKEEEKRIYRNNFLLGDHQSFLNVYNNNSNALQTAKELDCSTEMVIEKLIEILKYAEYINEKTPIIINNIDASLFKVGQTEIIEDAKLLIKNLNKKD